MIAKHEESLNLQSRSYLLFVNKTANLMMGLFQDMRVMMIQTKSTTNCFVVPLNRTAAADPSKIKPPSNVNVKVSDFVNSNKCSS